MLSFNLFTPTMEVTEPVSHVVKAQYIRLIDVFVIGPAMIYGGYKLFKGNMPLSALLVASGLMTIAYNGQNYVRNKDRIAA